MKGFFNMALRDEIVAGSRPVSVCNTCDTHSQLPRVLNAHWKGTVAFSAATAHCFAIVLATIRRNTSLTTNPPNPPCGFFRSSASHLQNLNGHREHTTCGHERCDKAQETCVPVRLQKKLEVFTNHSRRSWCCSSACFFHGLPCG